MADIQTTLRAEISRLARKELKGEITTLRKLLAQQRSHTAGLRRELQSLQARFKSFSKAAGLHATGNDTSASPANPDAPKLRFRAAGFATLRKKLGLSAKDMGALIGVSALTIYKWEKGETHPRQKQLEAIAATRGLGKKEALARVAAAASAHAVKKKPRARTKR